MEIKPEFQEPNLARNVGISKSTKTGIDPVFGERISVQRDTFLSRRVNTEAFLFALEKKAE